MANTKSAAKRARQTPKRTARNKAVKASVKTYVRKAREAIEGKDANLDTIIGEASKQLQKAASKGVIHKRNAARRLGRLAKAAAASKTAPKA